jgi:hypothetical protein
LSTGVGYQEVVVNAAPGNYSAIRVTFTANILEWVRVVNISMLMTTCPAKSGYYCLSGAYTACPPGSYCTGSAKVPCPSGQYSNISGSVFCAACPSGTFTSQTGSTSCQHCPGGHYCPPGTASWAYLNCGRGHYCPDGSGAPTPCPYQVPPYGGWGGLQVQGPAFLVDTANCPNHCFWSLPSGDGRLSKC